MVALRERLGKLRLGLKYLANLQPMRRDFTVFPDDTFLVGYPKTGTTWLRFIMANLLYPNQNVGFDNIEECIPDPQIHQDSKLRGMQRPRFLKTHEPYDSRFPKVIMIVRDPRDVLLSYHRYAIKVGKISTEATRSEFLQAFLSGSVDNYGSWQQNAGSWIGALEHEPARFFWFRYEDLLAEPAVVLARLVDFLGRPTTDQEIEDAMAKSSAEEMRKLEKASAHKWKALQQSDSNHEARHIQFVGKAQAGVWQELLGAEEVLQIENRWGPMMVRLGYALSSGVSESAPPMEAYNRRD